LWTNPVMFVVEIMAVLTTFFALRDLVTGQGATLWFDGQIAAWLWVTVLFANFAEALAEGRGKAQAAALRRTRSEILAKKLVGEKTENIPASELRQGDIVLVETMDIIPGDGEVIEGIASVDESAVTGESAPVIRESGGDRSSVTGGTRVLSDWIKVRITANPGETFLDRMINLVEGARRQKTPNEIALNILLLVMTFLTGIAYPLAVTGLAQIFFPGRANGSLIELNGIPVGSALIGQNFNSPRYFHGRPSAAGKDGYDATASAGANLGPTNKNLWENVAKQVAQVRKANGLDENAQVPGDLVTASDLNFTS